MGNFGNYKIKVTNGHDLLKALEFVKSVGYTPSWRLNIHRLYPTTLFLSDDGLYSLIPRDSSITYTKIEPSFLQLLPNVVEPIEILGNTYDKKEVEEALSKLNKLEES